MEQLTQSQFNKGGRRYENVSSPETDGTRKHIESVVEDDGKFKYLVDGVEKVVAGEIVDNLTTQDSNKSLSANQGFVLDTKIAEINETLSSVVQDKFDIVRYATLEDKITQEIARDIINSYANYEGKIIEFLTNGEAPNKTFAYGYVLADKDNNQYLVVMNNNGTFTQWNKTDYAENYVKNIKVSGVVDLDNFTIDNVGEPARFISGLEKAFNKPTESSDFGSLIVLNYNIQRQIQYYIDHLDGTIYFRLITGTDGAHTFLPFVKLPTKADLDKKANDNEVVKVVAQELTEDQKAIARNNIGAGASGFSGSYTDLTNKPRINSNNSVSLTATDEEIDATINLHKISKSGKFADLNEVPIANESVQGVSQKASDSEISLGENDTKFVTPKQLKQKIDSLGTIFDFKGQKETKNELPLTNNKKGDVWFVKDESVGYVWLKDSASGVLDDWEKFGEPIDLSGYVKYIDIVDDLTSTTIDKPLSANQGKVVNDLATSNKTAIENIANNTTKIATADGSFMAGTGAVTNYGGVAIGPNAKGLFGGIAIGKNSVGGYGGAIGDTAKAWSGGANGWKAFTNAGGAMGESAVSNNGFAGGQNATAEDGVSIGKDAKAGKHADWTEKKPKYIDAIQLGTGLNEKEKSLQIYTDNIYDSINHKLTVQNAELNGVDLQTTLNSKQGTLTATNAGDNITITEVGGVTKINSTASGGTNVTVGGVIQDEWNADTNTNKIAENTSAIGGLTTRVGTAEQGISNLEANKVSKETGKGLSSNDFTTEYVNQITNNTTNIGNKLDKSGGTLTGEVTIGQGDGKGLQFGTNGVVNANNTTNTIFGLLGGGALTVGHSSFNLKTRGQGARPTYNDKDLALKEDIPTTDNFATKKELPKADGTTIVSSVDASGDTILSLKQELYDYVADLLGRMPVVENAVTNLDANKQDKLTTFQLDNIDQIPNKQNKLTSANQGENITITEVGGVTKINATSITVDSALSDTSENPVQNKVIKSTIDNITNNATLIKNERGGFSAGNGANSTYGGAVGLNASTTEGGAAGGNANSTEGGAVGYEASTTRGGAIGMNAKSEEGGAVGLFSNTTGGGAVGVRAKAKLGGAVGQDAKVEHGGAIGMNAFARYGGAIGLNAKASEGFSGGWNAKTKNNGTDENPEYIDAIQLGTGTNEKEKSLQVYDKNIFNITETTLSDGTTATKGTLTVENAELNGVDLQTTLNGKQPNLTSTNAGDNITISGSGANVKISATGGGIPDRVRDIGNNNEITFQYSSGGNSNPSYYGVWSGYRLTYASTAQVASQMANILYPVGSIYMSTSSTNPSEYFGGTWVAWGNGRVPLGMGSNGETNYTTVEQTGGSENSVASHKHENTISVSATQSAHSHNLSRPRGDKNYSNGNANSWWGSNNSHTWSTDSRTPTITVSSSISNANAGSNGGNRMPFITCYMWKRTA